MCKQTNYLIFNPSLERTAEGEPQARATFGSGHMECKTMSRRTETAYKAWSPGKPAGLPFRVQHVEAQDSGDRVNAAVV